MNRSILFVALLQSLLVVSASRAQEAAAGSDEAIARAFDRLAQAATRTDWPSESEARKELAARGEAVIPKLTEAARTHGEARVRRACYELLATAFPKDERTLDVLARNGLIDQDAGIRYYCAFLVGDLKIRGAEVPLRAAFERATGKDEDLLRYTLAKSLAQLGAADVLRTLFLAVSDDAYMCRHVGNIGLKAISGKNLESFNGYAYAEGAWVLGGLECSTPFDALSSAEKKAGRFQAATAYFRWLKAERPELYQFATYTRRSRIARRPATPLSPSDPKEANRPR
jgi:hypothetical protein